MPLELQISVLPKYGFDNDFVFDKALRLSGFNIAEVEHFAILKRSVDARKKPIRYQLRVALFKKGEDLPQNNGPELVDVREADAVHIIGAGPAGMFAAMQLIIQGIKPIIYERGKDVRTRRKDLALISREQKVNPESNYCFGEGGAGTYSDGKLYTRSKKRGDVKTILQWLVYHGAPSEILVDAHPHIGTNKLPGIIQKMRENILHFGGEIHFDSRVTDFVLKDGKVSALEVNGQTVPVEKVIVATGHSARDIFDIYKKRELALEFKPFALGVRVEHPQALIDKIQYHCDTRDEFLPAAAYQLVHQVEGAGVYSFCMCPGGIIAPCATGPEEVVTNGWSPSKRNNPYANSGIVTEVRWQDIQEFHSYGAFAGIEFQKKVENDCWQAGGKGQRVPAQRLLDFIEGKVSESLPVCSYHPGVVSAPLHEILPAFVVTRLRSAFQNFGRKMKGYLSNDAIIVAPESRTSSPLRIPRHVDSLEHVDAEGIYPCGEGAGYAGGIVSAALDGIKIARKCIKQVRAGIDDEF